MMTDPIADMLTRLRNANRIGAKRVDMPASTLKVGIAQILKEEGFVNGYEVQPGKPSSTLRVELKYGPDGERVIRHIRRISKPGCRVYSPSKKLPKVLRGHGISIISTPSGVLSDRAARTANLGGEVLCEAY
jgi:small subunit ribosomal protein S8